MRFFMVFQKMMKCFLSFTRLILNLYLNSFFNEDEVKQFLKFFFYPNFNTTPENLYLINGATGKNPLELVNFVKYNFGKGKQSVSSLLKNYMNRRYEEIWQDHAIFYKKNMSGSTENLENFLGYFLKIFSEEEIKNKSYELYIDKKYIYIDESLHILCFICPIAKRVFRKFYINKMQNFPNEETVFLTSIPMILEKSALNNSGKGSLLEFYIVSTMQQQINKKFTLLYSIFSEKLQNFEQYEMTLEYKAWQYFSSNNLDEIKNLTENCLLVPLVSNFYAIDLLYWDRSTSIFYAFQCTVNLISHDRSDAKFKNSEFCKELLKTKKGSMIRFVWICGPSSLTLEQIEKEFTKKDPINKRSRFLFPNKNTEIFKNLNTY